MTKISSNWRAILKRSFSFWGNIFLAAGSGIAGGFAMDGSFYWKMAAANLLVAALRLVAQKEL